jgi:hypothetical protein
VTLSYDSVILRILTKFRLFVYDRAILRDNSALSWHPFPHRHFWRRNKGNAGTSTLFFLLLFCKVQQTGIYGRLSEIVLLCRDSFSIAFPCVENSK